jgi:hypothetical protein
MIYYLLTSPEVGIKKVEIEKITSRHSTCDIYIPEVNVILEINGPAHYLNRKNENEPFIKVPNLCHRHKISSQTKIVELNISDGQFLDNTLDPSIN